MAVLATTTVTIAGTAPTLAAAAAGGDKVEPGNDTWLHVKNGSGGALTVTIDSVVPSNWGTDVNGGGSVPAGAERFFGPLPASRFASPADGLVNVTYSGVTSLTVGAFKMGVS